MRRTYSQIGLDERRKIARWRTAGLSVAVIAEKLGLHRSTNFREVRRNIFVDKQMADLSGYYCVTAHEMACERRAKLRKLHEKKISQAQIARTLRRDRAGVPCSCTKSKQAFHDTPNPASRIKSARSGFRFQCRWAC